MICNNLETFILVLMGSGTESHGIIAQIIMMLVLINIVLNLEHH